MENINYSTTFDAIVVKVLTAADINSSKGHQHEFNGVAKLNKWFLGQKTDIKTRFVQIDCNGNLVWSDNSILTWYNVREKSPGREEYRMYYHKSIIFNHFNANDLMVILFKLASGIPEALMISVPLDSAASRNIAYLLKISKTTNLPPILLASQFDENTAKRIVSLLNDYMDCDKKPKKQSIKDRSIGIRETIDLSDITTEPDKCLKELYLAEKLNDFGVLLGYYEQLALVLIRNGVFFDYIREGATVTGINLGTFNNNNYRLYTLVDDISEVKYNPNHINYCVLLYDDTGLIDKLVKNGIIPIIIDYHDDGCRNYDYLSLLTFIKEINSIQRG